MSAASRLAFQHHFAPNSLSSTTLYRSQPRAFRPWAQPTTAARFRMLEATAQVVDTSTGTVIVTDGTDGIYGIRSVFQDLHDYGKWQSIRPFCSSVAKAKKMLTSREARYSGLMDKLDYYDGELADAMSGCVAWLGLNFKCSDMAQQIDAAKVAGVKRCILMFSGSDVSDVPALEAALQASGMDYTVIRTGELTGDESGAALAIASVDEAVCESMPLLDATRVACEALTVPESFNKMMSVCAADDASVLKEMRYAGADRRQEIIAMLRGEVAEATKKKQEEEAKKVAAKDEEVSKAKAELNQTPEEREAEIKNLLEKARQRGIEQKERMEREEAEKKKKREERQTYYKMAEPQEDDDDDDSDGDAPAAEEAKDTDKPADGESK